MRGELGSIEGIELRCGVSLTAVFGCQHGG